MILQVFLPRMAVILLLFSASMAEASQYFFPTRNSEDAVMYVSAYYTGFSDVSRNDTGEEKKIEPVTSLEMGFRLFYSYNFVLLGGKADATDESFYGAGVKINMPGFFLLFGKTRDLRSKSKKKPVNTALFTYILNSKFINSADTLSEGTETVLGISIDAFITKDLFITLGASTHNRDGDYFLGTSCGLGVEF